MVGSGNIPYYRYIVFYSYIFLQFKYVLYSLHYMLINGLWCMENPLSDMEFEFDPCQWSLVNVSRVRYSWLVTLRLNNQDSGFSPVWREWNSTKHLLRYHSTKLWPRSFVSFTSLQRKNVASAFSIRRTIFFSKSQKQSRREQCSISNIRSNNQIFLKSHNC